MLYWILLDITVTGPTRLIVTAGRRSRLRITMVAIDHSAS
jgi:hypothetical protein